MANICIFEMLLKGKESNMKKFCEALAQKKDIWIGRGADIYISSQDSNSIFIEGSCKWSIQSALIDNALSMRKQKDFNGPWYFKDLINVKEILTLFETCEKYHVNMEVYSEEPGCNFAEHFYYNNGKIYKKVGRFSETYNEEEGDYITTGGFPDKSYCIDDVKEDIKWIKAHS